MSKKQLIKDNIFVFIGANIANAFNYLINILLARQDTHLFNLYTAYTSISLIMLIPSLVTMRVFTVFGNDVFGNIKQIVEKRKKLVLNLIILLSLLLIPFNYFLTKITEEGTFITSFLLIILAILGLLGNVFRGIRQNEEDFKIAVISINIEALGRLILGYTFAVILGFGISGILLGHVIGFTGSLLICYKDSYLRTNIDRINDFSVKNVFINTLLMTGALEFISNFDILYSNFVLRFMDLEQTEFNTLQFIRKIIFFGIFAVSAVTLSVAGKNKHSKSFTFIFNLFLGFTIGLGMGIVFFVFQGIFLGILNKELVIISITQQVTFVFATIMMSTSYLLTNWLFTLKRKRYIYIPVLAALFQAIIFLVYGNSLYTLLTAYLVSSLVFFSMTFSAGLIEILNSSKSIPNYE
jgi:hypothetical protein